LLISPSSSVGALAISTLNHSALFKEAKTKIKKKTLAQFFRKKNKEPEAVVFFVIGLLRLLCT
jgi:hypothetical protein